MNLTDLKKGKIVFSFAEHNDPQIQYAILRFGRTAKEEIRLKFENGNSGKTWSTFDDGFSKTRVFVCDI